MNSIFSKANAASSAEDASSRKWQDLPMLFELLCAVHFLFDRRQKNGLVSVELPPQHGIKAQ